MMKGNAGGGPSSVGATPRRPPLLGQASRSSTTSFTTGRWLTWLSLVAGLYVAFR